MQSKTHEIELANLQISRLQEINLAMKVSKYTEFLYIDMYKTEITRK